MKIGSPDKSIQALDERFLDIISNPWYSLLVDIQDCVSRSTVSTFSELGMRNMHLPITTQSISSPMGLGSDSQPVRVDMFGIPTYLADSMQFMLEYGCRYNPQGAYYIMPSFRGEDADETHLCQFFHSEVEISGDLDAVMRLVEHYLRSMTEAIYNELGSRIADRTGGTLEHLESFLNSSSIPVITTDEAVKMLGADNEDLVRWHDPGFHTVTRSGEHELMRRSGGFCWITEPDHISVPFYQAYSEDNSRKAKAADLLIGLGETVGGGERHQTPEQVRHALSEHEVDADPYNWYLSMREHHPMKTSGFGLGVERYICWLLSHDDIRDCQLLERYNGKVTIP